MSSSVVVTGGTLTVAGLSGKAQVVADRRAGILPGSPNDHPSRCPPSASVGCPANLPDVSATGGTPIGPPPGWLCHVARRPRGVAGEPGKKVAGRRQFDFCQKRGYKRRAKVGAIGSAGWVGFCETGFQMLRVQSCQFGQGCRRCGRCGEVLCRLRFRHRAGLW
jgi:hypothetical protein